MANWMRVTSQKIEQHLRDCHKCEEAYSKRTRLWPTRLAQAAPYYKAPLSCVNGFNSPYETRSARRTAAALQERFAAGHDGPGRARVPFSSEMPWNWLALAAAIVLVALIACSLVPRLQQPGADQFLATQLIASHVRSLMANHLTDVASSDQHTVKPWLDAKLDFAPPVVGPCQRRVSL